MKHVAKYDRSYLGKLAPSWEPYLLPGKTTDGIITGFLAELARTPKIAQCSPTSVALCLLLCARLGFEPSSPLGHVYLVPYGGVLTPIVGYRGLLELLRRSAEVRHVAAGVVYRDELEGGLFSATLEPPEIHHAWHPTVNRADDQLVAAYCSVLLINGARHQTILTREQIEARRARGHDGPAWRTDYAAMARKSAIRALLSSGLVPLSADDQRRVSAVWEAECAQEGDTPEPPARIAPAADPLPPLAQLTEDLEATEGDGVPTQAEIMERGSETHGDAWPRLVGDILGPGWDDAAWDLAERARVASLL